MDKGEVFREAIAWLAAKDKKQKDGDLYDNNDEYNMWSDNNLYS